MLNYQRVIKIIQRIFPMSKIAMFNLDPPIVRPEDHRRWVKSTRSPHGIIDKRYAWFNMLQPLKKKNIFWTEKKPDPQFKTAIKCLERIPLFRNSHKHLL